MWLKSTVLFGTSPLEEGGLTEARDADNNIIISDLTLCKILPHYFKKNQHSTRSRVVASVEYLPKVCIRNYYHGGIIIWRK